MKSITFSIISISLALISSISVNAQDKLIKKNGDIIESKVKSIDNSTIVYKKFSNQEGPNYIIDASELSKIVFENGQEQIFSNTTQTLGTTQTTTTTTVTEPKPQGNVCKNIFAFSPMQLANPGSNSLGLGAHYERILNEDGIISFYFPAAFIPKSNESLSNYSTENKYGNMLWLYPGFKIYPGGFRRSFSYAIGASFMYGTGTYYKSEYDYMSGQYIMTNPTCNIYGMMIQNSLNISIKNACLGFEGGIGFPYGFSTVSLSNSGPLLQLKFFVGYKF